MAVLVAACVLAVPEAARSESDVTNPVVAGMWVAPAGADVTNGDASFTIGVRLTDDLSGVRSTNVSVRAPNGRPAGQVSFSLVSGTEMDGMYNGTFTIPRFAQPGRYSFNILVEDRVFNTAYLQTSALDAAGLASGVDITDANPDTTPPSITSVTVSPAQVDVLSGPAVVTFDVGLADAQSGVESARIQLVGPPGAGLLYPLPMSRVSGTASSGTWRMVMTVPQYSRQGQWSIRVLATDVAFNTADVGGDLLTAAGFAGYYNVISNEDVTGPQYFDITVTPSEVDTRQADQVVKVQVRIVDEPAGIRMLSADVADAYVFVHAATGPALYQGLSASGLPRLSGTAQDGIYEGTIVVPKQSATGTRTVDVSATDAVGNYTSTCCAIRTPLVVYGDPRPPVITGAVPGVGMVTLSWNPPTDDGGLPVTDYVVRVMPGGRTITVPGSDRSLTVADLANEVAHSFTVAAVTRAGQSPPSAAVTATPSATTPTTAPGPSPPPAAAPPQPSGYWLVSATGGVYGFGDARPFGQPNSNGVPIVDLEPTASRSGYWVVDAAGHVFAFGDAPYLGGAGTLPAGERVTSVSGTPSGRGYWLFTDRGRVLAFGDAPHVGDLAGHRLNGPVLDSAPTPSGRGYYLVASDGGVFCFGDARFQGSMGAARLNAPVRSLVPAAGGTGYWLVATDGGVFAFGAPFYGSTGSLRLNRPISGMVGSPSGRGYLMVAEDGGVFAFGDVPFRGSLGASPPPAPIRAVAAA